MRDVGGRWLLALALVALPSAAAAQAPGGPFGGLFGRTPPRTGQDVTLLEARTAIGGLYDGALPGDGGAVIPNEPTSATTGGANAEVLFERRRDRLEFTASTGATYQEVFRTPRFGATWYQAATTVRAKVGTRLTLDGSASAIRSPFFQLAPTVPAPTANPEVIVPAERFAVRLMDNDAFEGVIGFTSQYTKRSSISANVSRRQTKFQHQPQNNFDILGGHGVFLHQLTRSLSLRFGYGREEARQRSFGDGVFVHEVIDAGVDLHRELTVPRRTSLSFSSQTSIIREAGGPRHYRLNGGATLARGFRRTWNVALLAARDTTFLPGFVAPLFSNSASLATSGLLARRIEWTASVGARRGQVGFDRGNPFISYSGNTRLSTGLTRHSGLYCQYTYYHYELPLDSTVLELLPRFSRQQLSVGVTMWLPIFTHVRAPRGPR